MGLLDEVKAAIKAGGTDKLKLAYSLIGRELKERTSQAEPEEQEEPEAEPEPSEEVEAPEAEGEGEVGGGEEAEVGPVEEEEEPAPKPRKPAPKIAVGSKVYGPVVKTKKGDEAKFEAKVLKLKPGNIAMIKYTDVGWEKHMGAGKPRLWNVKLADLSLLGEEEESGQPAAEDED